MKLVVSGIKPTGRIQLGNYFGMIKEIIAMQDKYKVFLMIADLHAQTVPYKPAELQFLTYELASSLLALGIDPQKTVIFKQSDIASHLYLYWILGCLSYFGELQLMHEFKEQAERYKKQGVGVGILMYPVLQAADVLLYNADLVPVGKDQVQHLELARQLARRFNKRFGQVFKIPEIYLREETAKIMSLDNPYKKMSKSSPEGCLEIFASEKEIKEKIKRAVTDSSNEIKFDPETKPGISNLMIIYKCLTGKVLPEIEQEFFGLGYADFKEKIIEAFFDYFKKAREKKRKISKGMVNKILKEGARQANRIAEKNLKTILKIVGLR
ncbi:MAG: tryptophan--tRNA ligase [Candidatus Parcubacteria bacterium]|nr:MAG: tryptophan--tRNA ligase [Candidatus Parcubacteria bacterium]